VVHTLIKRNGGNDMNESYLYTSGENIEKEMEENHRNNLSKIFIVPVKKIIKITNYLSYKYEITMLQCENKKFAKLKLKYIGGL